MTQLVKALSRLDKLDRGETAQDFYFLRQGYSGEWVVHYRSPNNSDWRYTRSSQLAVAIENALIDMEENPYVGQEYKHSTHDTTPDDDFGDLI